MTKKFKLYRKRLRQELKKELAAWKIWSPESKSFGIYATDVALQIERDCFNEFLRRKK